MLTRYISQRLQNIGVLPELKYAFDQMTTYDQMRATKQSHWSLVIPTLRQLLGGNNTMIEPFVAAWLIMYAYLIRLDHLQDGDPTEDPLPTANQPNAQYNLVFSYYVLADSILDELSPEQIPVIRILRLRRLWSDMMLQVASGQQRDLTASKAAYQGDSLEYYEQIVQAKAGAAFALAFGGTAMLLTDDMQLVNTLTVVGNIYGMLLQYSDDLLDSSEQNNATLTLSEALRMAHPTGISKTTSHTPETFWSYVYANYHAHVQELVKHLPVDLQQGLLQMFEQTFGSKH
ncbi:MAG: polyprenyl synthetase family protein [Chloroflexota bacterium]